MIGSSAAARMNATMTARIMMSSAGSTDITRSSATRVSRS